MNDKGVDDRNDGRPEGVTKGQAGEETTHPPSSSRRVDHFAERSRHAFLFHMWAAPRRSGKAPLWRFSLEEVETGVRHGFGNLDALVAFLQQRMATE